MYNAIYIFQSIQMLFNTVQRLQVLKTNKRSIVHICVHHFHFHNSHNVKLNTSYTGDENEVELVIIAIANIKVMHHTNIGITGTIRRNLQRTTISYKHIQLHMEKK
ncbi:putative alpha-2-macroglobulin [Trichinella spiralis]|uniref:putative alpha-2-macroglobulin n=1 Tax=Trichinella spiralis TaxID=6334 RepID=UPI0001EFD98C|nr:putative alpha-2-macroglobulin [Trichinella spiralis]